MNVCFLTPRFPYPEIGGDSLRVNNVAKYFKRKGHKVYLVSFYGEKEPDVKGAYELYEKIVMVKRNSFESCIYSFLYLLKGKPIQIGYFYSPRFLKALKSFIKKEEIDLFIPHALRLTEYIVKLGLVEKTIVEQTDAISKTYAMSNIGRGNSKLKFFYGIESKLTPKYEEYMLRTFRKVVYVSPSDVSYLSVKYPWQKTAACYTNGFDLPETIVENYNCHKICLMGNMRTLQNQDAAIFFKEEVFPLILQKEPDTVFYIVGAEPSKRILDLASDHIVVTGFVDRVEDVIQDACMCVAPVRIAAGIQNKVLVSMGCGVPVIMSSLIAQPIPELENEINCIIEDNPNRLAEHCLSLMKDKNRRNSIAAAGRQLIKDHYSWDKTLEGYETFQLLEAD